MKRDTSLAAAARLFAMTLGLPALAAVGQAHADELPAPAPIISQPGAAPATSTDVANIDIIQTQPVAPPPPPTSQKSSNGLIRDSHLDFEFRNYTDYLHSDDGIHRHAWVGGMQAQFQSGFTKGPIGFGFDASLFGALKFDGGQGAGNMVYVGKHGGGANRLAWAYPGAYDVKARISETVFKYGLHDVSNPFIEPHDNRALPPTFSAPR